MARGLRFPVLHRSGELTVDATTGRVYASTSAGAYVFNPSNGTFTVVDVPQNGFARGSLAVGPVPRERGATPASSKGP